MVSSLPIQAFLEAAESLPVIDVRSPSEFQQGHIPGAYNIPLFTDKERAEIGTLYKQKGRDAAFKRGLELVGPKMRSLVEESDAIAPNRNILVHCWRGGMRSSSFGWLLNSAGFEIKTLQKGYKAFRNFVLDIFAKKHSIAILSGYTGSGKTEVLHVLGELGEQVIDLEGLAQHKGSAFGHLGEQRQPTGEQFQNRLGMKLMQIDSEKPVWLEDESRFIGKRMIPKDLFKQMREAPVFRLEVPREERVERLVKDYGKYPISQLKESVLKIKKRLGGLRTQQAIEALEKGNLSKVAEFVLHYYDKAYDYGIKKRDTQQVHRMSFSNACPREIAHILKKEALIQSV
ncbi:MAG: tRNA 2-selenouridine(34) synthase MnmH [Balneolaceae bacterium]